MGSVFEGYCEGVCIGNLVPVIFPLFAQHTSHRCLVSYTIHDVLATTVSWSDCGRQKVALGQDPAIPDCYLSTAYPLRSQDTDKPYTRQVDLGNEYSATVPSCQRYCTTKASISVPFFFS